MSGQDAVECTGVHATQAVGAAQVIGSATDVEKTFAGVSRFGLKKEHSEEMTWAGLCQFAKWNESMKSSLFEMCQVAPKSAVAATWRPCTGPVKESLRTLVREVRPKRFSLYPNTFVSPPE